MSVIGFSEAESPVIYQDNVDVVVNFWTKKPKELIKTLKVTADWALTFFQQCTPLLNGIKGLGVAKLAFSFSEISDDCNKFRHQCIDYYKSFFNKTIHVNLLKVGEHGLTVLGKLSDAGKWLFEVGVIALSAETTFALGLMAGTSLIYTFANASMQSAHDISAIPTEYDRSYSLELWKLAKHISLLVTGILITLASFGILYSKAMLITSTIGLIAGYAICFIRSTAYEVQRDKNQLHFLDRNTKNVYAQYN